jgi:hypothetical protein
LAKVLVVVLASLGLAFAGIASLERSLIPLALDDEVVSINYLSESGDVLMWVGFRDAGEMAVDTSVVESFYVGGHVEKAAWSTSLEVGEGSVALRPSGEFWRLVVAQLGALVVATMLVVPFSPREFIRSKRGNPHLEGR